MKRDWTRQDGLTFICVAVALFIGAGCVALFGGPVLIPLITRTGAQAVVISGVVVSLATFLIGLYVLTGRLDRRSE